MTDVWVLTSQFKADGRIHYVQTLGCYRTKEQAWLASKEFSQDPNITHSVEYFVMRTE